MALNQVDEQYQRSSRYVNKADEVDEGLFKREQRSVVKLSQSPKIGFFTIKIHVDNYVC